MVKDNSSQGDIIKFCSTVSNHQDALQIFQAANSLVGQDSTHSLMGLGNGGRLGEVTCTCARAGNRIRYYDEQFQIVRPWANRKRSQRRMGTDGILIGI